LFFSVVKVGDGYCGVISHLPAQFNPRGSRLIFKFGGDKREIEHDYRLEMDYMKSLISSFINGVHHAK
jgi:hypothetical protein